MLIVEIIEERPGWGGGGGRKLRPSDNRPIPLISRPFPQNLLHFGHAVNPGGSGCVAGSNRYLHLPVMDFSQIELGPRMQACDERERKFVWFYLTNEGSPNGAQAARDAGYSDSSDGAKVRAHALLHRERVILALEEVGRKAFRGLLGPAIKATAAMINDPKHVDHAKVVSSTLARLGLTERTGVDVSVSGEVTVNHTDQALHDLRVLLELGVPREKLVETFGFSGLSRYEKMLAETDARAPKVIEHRRDEVSE